MKRTETLKITSIAPGGEAIARTKDGLVVFVPRACPQDVADIELYDIRKDFAYGRIVNLVEPSDSRVEPHCKLFKVCGGCQWQHIAYQAQLDFKTQIVTQAIKQIAKINELPEQIISPTLPSPSIYEYRNKVQFPVAHPQGSTRFLAGYYQTGSHKLVNVKHCPIQPQAFDKLLEICPALLEQLGFQAYNEKTHQGLIRHIVGRLSIAKQTMLLCLVLNTNFANLSLWRQKLDQLANLAMKAMPNLVGVLVNLNNKPGNKILGDQTICLKGSDHIFEVLSSSHLNSDNKLKEGIKFKLSVASFFQVNSKQTEQLLDLLFDATYNWQQTNLSANKKIPLIVDAYAGVGTIAIWLSSLAEKVLAFEAVPDAVKDGQEILYLNNTTNVSLSAGCVEDLFLQLLQQKIKPDICVLDPPRKGVSEGALETIKQLGPACILYVSCQPATLARDLKILSTHYTIKKIQPLDMFPQTYHVETLVILNKLES